MVSSDLPMCHVTLQQFTLVPMTLYPTFRKGTSSSIDYRLCQLQWPDMLMTWSLCMCFLHFLLKGAKCRKPPKMNNDRLLHNQCQWQICLMLLHFVSKGSFQVVRFMCMGLRHFLLSLALVFRNTEYIMVTMSLLSLCVSISSLSSLGLYNDQVAVCQFIYI